MAAIAERGSGMPGRPRVLVPTRRRTRAEGIRIDATRTSVYDVLVDADARRRWLGPNSRVEHASVSIYHPRVRTGPDVWAEAEASVVHRGPLASVTLVARQPDGAEVALTFVLHAVPFATIVELHHEERAPAASRHRPTSAWRASHWRRRCLDALRHEVEARAPRRLGTRRRPSVPPSPR